MKHAIVYVPDNMNLEQSKDLLVAVLGKLGCPNCYSGFRISFEQEVEANRVVLAVDAASKSLREVGR